MKNKYTHIVEMRMDEGYIIHLEAVIDEESGDIFFVRDDDGVTAWHCGCVNRKDHNVVNVKKI